MRTKLLLYTALFVGVSSLTGTACNCNGGPPGEDAGPADTGFGDVGDSDVDIRDTGIDLGPPTPRTMVDMSSLLGTMPVANRVEDPLFHLGGGSWLASGGQEAIIYRQIWGRTPADAPVLLAAGDELFGRPYSVFGRVKFGDGPHHVTVWVGTEAARPPDPADSVELSVTGWQARAPKRLLAVDLERDEDTRRRIGRHIWHRWEATFDDDFVGWGLLQLDTPGDVPVALNGAVLVLQSGVPSGAVELSERAEVREARESERRAWERMGEIRR